MIVLTLTYVAWRRYLWAAQPVPGQVDDCPFSLTDVFDERYPVNAPHQRGVRWLTEVFSRSARKFPNLVALQIPHSGESLTYAELDAGAEKVARAIAPYLTGPDQVVAVAMSQDNWQIVAAHLGILRAGATLMFLDSALPDALITHMLNDAQPVLILTRGQERFRDLPTLDLLALPDNPVHCESPHWLDDPTQRLATLFYTSGSTGTPKGVECTHAGYVNLALSYADFYDLMPGMDATSLTSSLGYDGSISEMYSAWVSGCTVVMLTKDEVRSGPDLVPILCAAEVTVLFCPPVLLTTLTASPELHLPYPICRYIVPAGEAFPSALVEPWTRARRQIINTYGPTEASTDTSRQSLRPGEPITIGSPFANVTYLILEEDGLQPLPHGDIGELCIGGVQIARGYRNLPEQTAQKFIEHPRFGRLYRTGDKGMIDTQTKRVHFLGRLDTQLKVRGHRVEAQAVEDMLQSQFAEIEAAVVDYQCDELIAFVTAPSVSAADRGAVVPAPARWAARSLATLARQLPGPSVPTRMFLVERFELMPVSGKIDRASLPDLSQLLANGAEQAVDDSADPTDTTPTGTDGEDGPPDGEGVLTICRDVFEAPLDWDDVFADHGGHSIIIAQLAQRLYAAGWRVSVRSLLDDCNTARKVAECSVYLARDRRSAANVIDAGHEDQSRDEVAASVLGVGFFTSLQVVFLLILYSPPLLLFLGLVTFAEIEEFFTTAGIWAFLGAGLLTYLFALIAPFASLLWVMIIKLFMGGHIYRNNLAPGDYPKWSKMHLRVWFIGRMERSVTLPLAVMYRSAPLMAYTLRRLGATVGSNLQCAHDVEIAGPLDLLTIGDNVAIQTGAYLQMSRWSAGELQIGRVCLGNGCKIGMRAAVANNVTVGSGSWIGPFTPVLSDVGASEMWEGAPARLTGHCTELKRTANTCKPEHPSWLTEGLNIMMGLSLDSCLIVIPTAAVSWFAVTIIPVDDTAIGNEYFRVTPLSEIVVHMGLYSFVTTWVSVVLVSLLLCLFIRCTAASPGLYSSRGFNGYLLLYRMKKMNQIQQRWTWTITGQYLRALAGMRFPRLGASECDYMFNLVPELASADSQVFWSNGCFTNMLDYGAEHIKLRQLDMPRNFFSGNNSVAEYGFFPSNFLLGVSTPGNDIQFRRQLRTRQGEPLTVAGNPPVRFASAQFEEENATQKLPTLMLFSARVFLNDIFSIAMLPSAGILVYICLFTGLLRLDVPLFVNAFIALLCAEAVLVLFSVLIKKCLVGTWGKAHSTPFWSWRHFSYFFAQDCFFSWCARPLGFAAGTVLPNIVLRWMGCRIGGRTIVSSPLQASDWNAVSFGSDCMINGFLQLHSFEGMVLKVKRTEIGDGSDVNFGATVMAGVVIESGSALLPLSLVLKEMYLPTATYHGSPAEPVGDKR